jgi:pimeloyl-ACP methyl ester carboxylesterase/tetratricopeptide (TPR) repeat protein
MATRKPNPRVGKSAKRGALKRRAARRRASDARPDATRGALPEHLIRVDTRAEIRPAAARAAGVPATVSIADHRDDVVEVQLEGGGRFFTRFDQFVADFGGMQAREAAVNGQFVIPTTLTAATAERGAGAWVIKTLRLLGIDPIDDAAELTGTKVCAWYEQKQLQRREGETDARTRLWRIAAGDTFQLNAIDRAERSNDPLLLFLHGTASSSRGSFGELWTAPAREVRNRILRRYGANAYALEHFSLTQSPMQNALDLLDALPDGARLHLVSHSRGGLIGELLCRGQMVGRDPFEEDEIGNLFSTRDYATQADELRDLNKRLKAKKLKVERFVRVACPARGTILASERIDRWLSLSLDAIGTVGDLATSGFYAVFEEFVKAFVRTREDPRKLPGLEVQMPTSPVVRLLNRADIRTAADLHVIAGDIEGGSLWRRLGILLSDVYYREDHDLVVNTRAMYGGTPRVEPPRRFFTRGPEVYHFTYFRNPETAAKVADALEKAPQEDGFDAFDQRIAVPSRGYRGPVPGARGVGGTGKPIVFVLPGIMGSCLDARGQRVWVDLAAINRGDMAQLAIDATGITPSALMPDSYSALIEFLDGTHEVVPFPFDWRLSLRAEAKRLATAIKAWLDEADRRGQPLALVAHSLGGLLARVMIADFPELWERIVAKPQGRLVMLGTPNGGSHSIPLMLLGRESVVQGLALVDFKHTQRKLIELIGRFPGVLELLPTNTADDFFDAAVWNRLATLDDNGRPFWTPPDTAALQGARAVRALLDRATPRLDRVLYVAGHAPRTPWQLHFDRPPGLPQESEGSTRAPDNFYFESIAEGDGRVPWSTGVLPGLRPWFMEAVHGDLAASVEHFDGLRELVTTGATDKLPTVPPAVGKRDGAIEVFRSATVPYVPDAEALEAAAVGRITRRKTPARAAQPIEVVVAHGNVVFSRSPVFVGHYEADAITSAEGHLDARLERRLSLHRQLNLYPGPLGTAEVFWGAGVNGPDFPGAVVVGLGPLGALSPAMLTSTFAHAAVAYATEQVERSSAPQGMINASIASLLIGTGWNAMPVRDSVVAILRALVHANNELARSQYGDRVRIGAVTFIELYEDTAIQATRALAIANDEADLAGRINAQRFLRTLEGGRSRAYFAEEGAWWHRLQITAKPDGSLSFNMLTDRARAEMTLQRTQRSLVEKFVKRQIATTAGDQDIAVTLFELLVPNRLKDQAPEGRDLVLVLDAAAAAYPWELLQDGMADAEGRSADGADPFRLRIALRAGLIRQLQTEAFRESVINATGDCALVIGDPQGDPAIFPELVGAQQEARTVAQSLRESFAARRSQEGNDDDLVTLLVRPADHEVVVALFKRAYRIVHLAGHGVVDYEVPLTDAEQQRATAGRPIERQRVTGMVLGKGVFLTPAEIAQMRRVPELVFVNCCHLGEIKDVEAAPTRDRHLLAANIATELIRIGVKAVVAAGWAVDDNAAELFARTFYEHILSGVTFGRAVYLARCVVAKEFPQSNTWGAYQCYGDPAFRLATSDMVASDRFGEDFTAKKELVIALDHLRSDALTSSAQQLRNINQRLDNLHELVQGKRPLWAADAAVCAAFGLALGEVDRFSDALAYFEKAVATGPANLSVLAVEQYANLLSRAAAARWRSRAKTARAAAAESGVMAQIDRGIAIIEQLMNVGKTSERLSILGAAYKRRAQVAGSATVRNAALRQMSENYKAAHELDVAERGAISSYPLLNWLSAEIFLHPAGMDATLRATAMDLLARVQQGLASKADADFWTLVTSADAQMTQALIERNLDDAKRDELLRAYRAVVLRAGSPRQLRSVIEHLDFLSDMYEASGTPSGRATAERIRGAADELRTKPADADATAQTTSETQAKPRRRARKVARKAPRKRR